MVTVPDHYLPKASPLPAPLLRNRRILRVAAELLQVTDREIPFNRELLAQDQSLKIGDGHHLGKEKGDAGDK